MKELLSRVQNIEELEQKSYGGREDDKYKVKEKYQTHKSIPLAAEQGYKAEWTGSYSEIRIYNPDQSIVLTIPSHGRWAQLGSTIQKIDDLGIILELAKKAFGEVFEP